MHWFSSLKVQIASALILIMLLFLGVFGLSQRTLEKQRTFNTLFSITAQLQHTAESMVSQGMVYSMGMPDDSERYQRDINIYRNHLMKQVELFHNLTMGFMHASFDPSLTHLNQIFRPRLTQDVQAAVNHAEEIWLEFREGIFREMAGNTDMRNVHTAAKHIVYNIQPLLDALADLDQQVETQAKIELTTTNRIYWGSLLAALIITFGILAWFFKSILKPLAANAAGFNRVAKGDFGYQLPVTSDNEIASMTQSFNHLSSRLNAIFKLIEEIQRGSDLDETLCFVAREFPQLLPLDWVGALFVAGDNVTITLERSYRNGEPESGTRTRFRLCATLLQQAIDSGEPLHISNMQETAAGHPEYEFLNHMAQQGLRDAIFLPITELSPIPGVLAFATEKPDSYNQEHLELMANIASLITHSFGRTVKMAEHTRLATIGSFASSIAHEIRSPLSTISMALEYFQTTELPGSASKRAELANQEAKRMARLLEEILMYAKPLQLELTDMDLVAFLQQFLETYTTLPEQKQQHFRLACDEAEATISGSRDRLTQLFLNLAQNACDAAPLNDEILWQLGIDLEAKAVSVRITNHGEAISEDKLKLLFEPFFTTKTNGTGLGLGIVKRIIEGHGGDIRIVSDSGETTVHLTIPLA